MKGLFIAPSRVLFFAIISLSACAQSTSPQFSGPASFDFVNPKVEPLADALQEISGMTFLGDSLLAVEDENGILYRFLPFSKALTKTQFGSSGDYEGLAIAQGLAVVLRSDGILLSVPIKELSNQKTQVAKQWKDLLPKAEYESFAYNTEDGLFYAICKQCDVDKKTDQTSGYKLSLSKDGTIEKAGEFKLEHSAIESLESLKGKKFRPSALALNPNTKQWYLLSSVNKMLVVLDLDLTPKEAFALDPKLFNQPEGLAFDKSGALYISNEGGSKTSSPTLVKFNLIP